MVRKLLGPSEACQRLAAKLRMVREANELLKRAQRALFALRRLSEKRAALFSQGDGAPNTRELQHAARLIRDVHDLCADEKGDEPALRDVLVVQTELHAVEETRRLVQSAADEALVRSVAALHQTDVGEALGVSHLLDKLSESVEACAEAFLCAARSATVSALRGKSDGEDADALKVRQLLGGAATAVAHERDARSKARDVADDWANAMSAAALRVWTLERVLRKKRCEVKRGISLFDVVQAKHAGAPSASNAADGQFSLTKVHWARATAAARDLVVRALAQPPSRGKRQAQEDDDAVPDAAAPSLGPDGFPRADGTTRGAFAGVTRFVDHLEQRVDAGAKLIESRLQRTNAEQPPARQLAEHYPVVRHAFVNAHSRLVSALSTGAIQGDQGESVDSAPAAVAGDGILAAVAARAPANSFVSLFEAQLGCIESAQADSRYSSTLTEKQVADLGATAAAKLKAAQRKATFEQRASQARDSDKTLDFADSRYAGQLDLALTRHRASTILTRQNEAPKAAEVHVLDDVLEFVPAAAVPAAQMCSLTMLLAALAPLQEAYLASAFLRLVNPVRLMFPDVEGFEAMIPSKHDVARFVTAARAELRGALEDGGEATLAPLILGEVAKACDEFAQRASKALADYPASRTSGFETLTAAIDDAAAAKRHANTSVADRQWRAQAGEEDLLQVRWRASATAERDAQLAALCAHLRAALSKLASWLAAADDAEGDGDGGSANMQALAPGLAALDAVGERVTFRGLDAVSYRVEVELSRMHREAQYSAGSEETEARRRSEEDDSGPSAALERALGALEAARVGYIAALPAWRSETLESPRCRAATLAFAARIARSFVSHVALYRPLGDAGRLRVAADCAVLEDALSSSFGDDVGSSAALDVSQSPRLCADEAFAAREFFLARAELRSLKRLIFAASNESLQGESAAQTTLRVGLDLVGSSRNAGALRPSTVWHHVVASHGAAGLPLPFDLEGAVESPCDYVCTLVAGASWRSSGDDDAPAAVARREAKAWRDVVSCLDVWAQRCAAHGGDLGDAYAALSRHGETLLIRFQRNVADAGRP